MPTKLIKDKSQSLNSLNMLRPTPVMTVQEGYLMMTLQNDIIINQANEICRTFSCVERLLRKAMIYLEGNR